ncbi:hypothetical protein FOZ60_010393 [Perkinsus olseni]|uniref:Uncharacterized protein n=1 Tax=Perkinsus olseni TaxID=32597 RepID=A0A7J6NFF9_PEROL|nr:hypothetical protein FOZ60_010393 [Perkinsus olseni]
MPPRRRRSTASSAHTRTPRRTPRRRAAPGGTPPPPAAVITPVGEATTRTAEVQTTPLAFEEEESGDFLTALQPTPPRTTPTSGNVGEEVLQLRAAMREMMQAIVQERNTSRNPGERREAHRVISEGYASSDFDSVQSGELPFEKNVRPTGERVEVDLLNPSADAPARVRVQFRMAHGSAEPPHRGNQTGTEFDDPVSQHHPDSDRRSLNQNYKERVRRECHKLAAKSEIFTGKSSQEITIASLHRDIEETAEDHGWDELSVGSYYLLRYPLSRSVWDNVIDSIGRSFDRSCAAGFKARVEAIWRVLERTYSNAVVRDKLKTQ